MHETRYDAIVVGLGGHGSACLYHLAKQGLKVIGLEQYEIAHDKGSSHGESRIIRIAYHEDPAYVPLLERAWELWKDLEEKSGQFLLCDTGCIHAADPAFNDGDNPYTNALLSAQMHSLDHEILTGDEMNSRYPGYQLPSHWKGVLSQGGILASERCIEAHVAEATKLGAEVKTGVKVLSWQAAANEGPVSIVTDKGTFTADKAVFAAGAWMPRLVPELQTVLRVERNVIGWFEILEPGTCKKECFPVAVLDSDTGSFYLFPEFEKRGMKIGKFDHLRERVDRPEKLKREITKQDEQVLRDGVAEFYPAANGKMLTAAACMFTNTTDHHFIIDKHPIHRQIAILSPCSGHGYKFCSVVGEIAAELVTKGTSRLSIDLCSIKPERPGFDALLSRFHANARGETAKL